MGSGRAPDLAMTILAREGCHLWPERYLPASFVLEVVQLLGYLFSLLPRVQLLVLYDWGIVLLEPM